MSKQSLAALEIANGTRLYLAEVRREMALGERDMAGFLNDPKLQGIRLRWGLLALPGVGSRRAADMLRDCDIHRGFLERPLRDLTQRQRAILIEHADNRHPKPSISQKVVRT